jgi:UDP-4-amino-4,6-dideoxy-N-acetyl-beta-L-altrosamine N-acetyltransferase
MSVVLWSKTMIFPEYYGIKSLNAYNFCKVNRKIRDEILRIRNSEHVRKWMYNSNIILPNEHHDFIDNLKKITNKAYYVVLENTFIVGCIYLNRIDINNQNAYLGIYANPFVKTNNKGQKLLDALFYLAFDLLKLHTLKLEVLSINDRAIKFYKKFGFKEEGVLREFVQRDNDVIDVIIMGILKREVKDVTNNC